MFSSRDRRDFWRSPCQVIALQNFKMCTPITLSRTSNRIWNPGLFFVGNTRDVSGVRRLPIRLKVVVTVSVQWAVDSHVGKLGALFAASRLEVIPGFTSERGETVLAFHCYAFGPKPPASTVAAQVIVSQHFVVSFGTTRLESFPAVWPKVNSAC